MSCEKAKKPRHKLRALKLCMAMSNIWMYQYDDDSYDSDAVAAAYVDTKIRGSVDMLWLQEKKPCLCHPSTLNIDSNHAAVNVTSTMLLLLAGSRTTNEINMTKQVMIEGSSAMQKRERHWCCWTETLLISWWYTLISSCDNQHDDDCPHWGEMLKMCKILPFSSSSLYGGRASENYS